MWTWQGTKRIGLILSGYQLSYAIKGRLKTFRQTSRKQCLLHLQWQVAIRRVLNMYIEKPTHHLEFVIDTDMRYYMVLPSLFSLKLLQALQT